MVSSNYSYLLLLLILLVAVALLLLLVIMKIICLHTVNQFYVILSNTNNVESYLIDSFIGPKQVLSPQENYVLRVRNGTND